VDVRVKTFVREAAERLGFLCAEFEFAGPEAAPHDEHVYPLMRRVRFDSCWQVIEVSLVLSYMGQEYVAADLVTVDESGSNRRTEIGRRMFSGDV